MSDIWNYWKEIKDHNKIKVICMFCKGHKQLKHTSKCKNHLLKCRKVPLNIKQQIKKNNSKVITTEIELAEDQEIEQSESDQDNINQVDFSQNGIIAFDREFENATPLPDDAEILSVTEMPSSDYSQLSSSPSYTIKKYFNERKCNSNEIKNLLAKAIYSSTTAFEFYENNYFNQAFQKMGFLKFLPSRRELSNSLLRNINNEANKYISDIIKDLDILNIVIDVWANRRGHSVLNILLAYPQPVFHSTIERIFRSRINIHCLSKREFLFNNE